MSRDNSITVYTIAVAYMPPCTWLWLFVRRCVRTLRARKREDDEDDGRMDALSERGRIRSCKQRGWKRRKEREGGKREKEKKGKRLTKAKTDSLSLHTGCIGIVRHLLRRKKNGKLILLRRARRREERDCKMCEYRFIFLSYIR